MSVFFKSKVNKVYLLVRNALRKVNAPEFMRYFFASLIALSCDVWCLSFLVERLGLNYLLAATLSFVLGACVAFLLSVIWVFDSRSFGKLLDGFSAFLLIGVVGLLINISMILFFVEVVGFYYMGAKAGAAFFSFGINFLMRKYMLFTAKGVAA